MKFSLRSYAQTFTVSLLALFPLVSFAAPQQLRDVIVEFTSIVFKASLLIGAFLMVAFIWGIGRFILNVGGSEKRAVDKQYLIWVVLVMFVMFGVVGLVTILQNTLL